MKKVYLAILVMALCLTGVKQSNCEMLHLSLITQKGTPTQFGNGWGCWPSQSNCFSIVIVTPSGEKPGANTPILKATKYDGAYTQGMSGIEFSSYQMVNVEGGQQWSFIPGSWSGVWNGPININDFQDLGEFEQ
jgi:hypothetical protein